MTFPARLPAARVENSMDAPPLCWGIMGPGWIASRFAESVRKYSRQQLVAVGSRSVSRSKEFARRYGIPDAYGSYEELAAAPGVDIIYIATTHNQHCECAVLALNAGKHVLVEKPLAVNALEAARVARVALEQDLFAAEALWTVFLPKFDVVRQILEQNMLGEIRSAVADYGEHFEPGHRIFDPALAGGPLLDLGTYPLSFLLSVLGQADRIMAVGSKHPSGVDGQISALMTSDAGVHGSMSTNLYNFTPTTATVVGTRGVLTIERLFNMPGPLHVRFSDNTVLRYEEAHGRHVEGLHYEAADVARCIVRGETETRKRPLEASIQTLEAADRIRQQLAHGPPL
ncbi:Gfo/Idh/MocA family protein [Arthrobacter sp. H14]|uniref:Gfo/Idh/MocA family protein n=1 Tax=Arthrobacter sp. H14 TaxID=1312959 RepID=UPI00047EB1CD|nr:Gfo/Idh/MocA family oxidoreductase [Arthrobacter sp. H14]